MVITSIQTRGSSGRSNNVCPVWLSLVYGIKADTLIPASTQGRSNA